MNVERARRTRQEMVALCHAGLDSRTLGLRAEKLLRTVIPFDFSCWHNVDPATLMLTSVIGEAPPTTPLLPVLEYGSVDANQYALLARSTVKVAGLAQSLSGHPEGSQRYREVLEPMGVADELTSSFVIDGMCWGCARLYRSRRWPAFDAIEVAFMASLCGPLAEGFRTALLVPVVEATDAKEGPGLLILDAGYRLDSMTPAAEHWLAAFVDSAPGDGTPLPHPVYAVATRAVAIARGTTETPLAARARVPTRDGRWLVLHASTLQGAGEERTAVIIEPAHSAELAPVIVRAYGLTERERQIAGLVLRGLGNKEIAAALEISHHTVSDFLKSIFDKVSVNSRTELAGRLFFDHYAPRMDSGARPGGDGWFAEVEPEIPWWA